MRSWPLIARLAWRHDHVRDGPPRWHWALWSHDPSIGGAVVARLHRGASFGAHADDARHLAREVVPGVPTLVSEIDVHR